MWRTSAECARVRLRGLPPLYYGTLLLCLLLFPACRGSEQQQAESEIAEAVEEVEEEAPTPLRAFRKPNRIADEDAVLSMRLLLIAPLLGLLALILGMLLKPKENTSVFKEPTPVPRKQKGGTSSSYEGDDWGSDSTYF